MKRTAIKIVLLTFATVICISITWFVISEIKNAKEAKQFVKEYPNKTNYRKIRKYDTINSWQEYKKIMRLKNGKQGDDNRHKWAFYFPHVDSLFNGNIELRLTNDQRSKRPDVIKDYGIPGMLEGEYTDITLKCTRTISIIKNPDDAFGFLYSNRSRFAYEPPLTGTLICKNLNIKDNTTFRDNQYSITSGMFYLHVDSIDVSTIKLRDHGYFIGSARSVRIYRSAFKSLIVDLNANNTFLDSVTLDSASSISIGPHSQINYLNGKGILKIERLNNRPNLPDSKIKISNIDLNHLEFPDNGIEFIVDTSKQDYLSNIGLYNQLVSHYLQVHELKKKYDIRLQQLINEHDNKWFIDFIQQHWNNYGYDKNLVFRNAFILVFSFFIINLFIYPKILYRGYKIKEFETADYQRIQNYNSHTWKIFLNVYYCFVYTSFIFWGLKLDLEKIKVSKLCYALWIIVQYTVGIICLGYIANIVISKA